MSLDNAGLLVRRLGGILALLTLALIFYGIWRGTRRQAGRTTGRAPGLLRSSMFYWITGAGFFGASYLLWKPLPFQLTTGGRIIALVVGCLLYFPGMIFVLWGRLALGKMYFVSTGMGAQLFEEHRLVTRGPFAIMRHPMYTGISLAVSGGLLLYQTWAMLFLLLLPLALIRRARIEEKALAAEFGVAWQEYCRDVPAWIPRILTSRRAH